MTISPRLWGNGPIAVPAPEAEAEVAGGQ